MTLNKYLEGLGTTGFGPAQVSDAPNPILQWRTRPHSARGPTPIVTLFPIAISTTSRLNGECGRVDNQNFGSDIPGTRLRPGPDDADGESDPSTGSSRRASSRRSFLGCRSRCSTRGRWYGNIRVMDDLSVTPASYSPVTITAPADSRLPNGGGYTLTGMGLSPTAAASELLRHPVEQLRQTDRALRRREHHRSMPGCRTDCCCRAASAPADRCSTTARSWTTCLKCSTRSSETRRELFFFAAQAARFLRAEPRVPHVSPGPGCLHDSEDRCAGQRDAPESAGAVVESNANYGVIPGVAGPGPFVPFKTFQIVEPGELFVERLNQLDFRVAKVFRVGRRARTSTSTSITC